MAKKAKIEKAKKQAVLIEQYADLRRRLKQEKNYAALAKLPKDANPNRLKLRDQLDGRPRGYMRKFGMSRIKFRKLAHQGLLPGVRKASW
ncbi:30S ribosomal protein S14 [Enterococcus cecorum]|nr:30S ribosomal protein S14 [Enterococcus cecorum]